jgi:MFS family permease
MAPQDGWRWLFFMGALPALLVFYVRRFVPESQLFVNAKKDPLSPLAIFSPGILKTTILTSLLCLGIAGGALAITIWLPTFLRTTRGLSVPNSGGYLLVYIAGAIIGGIVSGYLADSIGRRKNFAVFAICSFATVVLFTYLQISDQMLLFLEFPLGFFTQGIFGAIGPFLSEQFPTQVRATGQGFAYSFGRAVGAFVPVAVGTLSAKIPLGEAIGLVSLFGYGLIIIVTFLLPETRGRSLEAIKVPT